MSVYVLSNDPIPTMKPLAGGLGEIHNLPARQILTIGVGGIEMIYQFNRDHYCDFNVFEDHRLPSRSYFIPFGTRAAAEQAELTAQRSSSTLVQLLSGEWDFKYYQRFADVPVNLNTDDTEFDSVPVPSCWQFTGYEEPFYVNQKYPFKNDPPAIPTDEPAGVFVSPGKFRVIEGAYNSVGVYRRFFEVHKQDRRFILSFLGAASCIEVYLNGSYIGYAEGSHDTAEFDLTEKIRDGKNELVAVVHKWTNGTYLECQDMFRNNGIFRDVLLYQTDRTHIWDYACNAKKNGGKYTLEIPVTVNAPSGRLEASLMDGERVVASASCSAADGMLTLADLNVREWNAEEPKLYDLYLTLVDESGAVRETVRERYGFKTVEIRNGIYLFNGQAIKLRGVNHHDSMPTTGFTMTAQDMQADIRLMKELNVNCVRTSHYPPDPLFLQLCDFYGLYVIDEADIETHGTIWPIYARINQISNDVKWAAHYQDRVRAMFQRDKNHACIALWSLGNEAGGWKCQDICYEMMKGLTTIPIHYEGVIRTKVKAYDVVSEMYPSVQHVADISDPAKLKKRSMAHFRGKPYVMCEYAHAMGVGPGNMEEYWQILYSDPKYMGGCVWEWCDHAVYHKNGKYAYTYGGDHGEYLHDCNFCVDGMVFPDRKPSTGALEMQNVYRPLRSSVQGNTVTVESKLSFANASYINAEYTVLRDQEVTASGALNTDIGPGASSVNEVEIPQSGDVFVNIKYTDARTGAFIAAEQHTIDSRMPEIRRDNAPVEVTREGSLIRAAFSGGYVVFSATTGFIREYVHGGRQMMNPNPINRFGQGSYLNLFRAPLDNDMNIKRQWEKAGYSSYTVTPAQVEVSGGGSARIAFTNLLRNGKKKLLRAATVFTVYANGCVDVQVQAQVLGHGLPALPRFGLCLEMPAEFENIFYYGRGDRENYPDMLDYAPVGEYATTVTGMHENYIKPQENGNRCDVRFAEISNADGDGLRITAIERPFCFNAAHYTSDQLSKWAHQEDVTQYDSTVLSVDGYMMGTGSNSCGSLPLDPYQFKARRGSTIGFRFNLSPIE